MTSPTVLPNAIIAAWQAALAAEHAAIFGYGVLGPQLALADVASARTDEAAHRSLRDATASTLVALNVAPVASLGDYLLPFAVNSPITAGQLALQVEVGCASAWRYLYASAALTANGLLTVRDTAQTALTASAVRGLRWRMRVTPATPTVAFPGI